jgi:thiosulfate/3-mercaptopyruvate sulfurtransferase
VIDGERPGLISTGNLADRMADPALRVVDGSWYLPSTGRSGRGEYDERHISGAVFFDIDAISDTGNPLPHMLPSAEKFGHAVSQMGISDQHTIVVYDGAGLFSAARVRWMFLVMGATDVTVLDGGLPKWMADGRPVTDAIAARPAATFTTSLNTSATVGLDAIRDISASQTAQIVDARSGVRFRGEVAEARAGVKSGRIPGSYSVPLDDLLADGRLKPVSDLRRIFAQAGVDLARPVVTSCGSGVTAAAISLALEQLGSPAEGLYDGSWSEWGGRDDTEIVTGD